jgi:hypothetical protein
LSIPPASEASLAAWIVIGCGSHVRCCAAVVSYTTKMVLIKLTRFLGYSLFCS